jgi:hypothetical protein
VLCLLSAPQDFADVTSQAMIGMSWREKQPSVSVIYLSLHNLGTDNGCSDPADQKKAEAGRRHDSDGSEDDDRPKKKKGGAATSKSSGNAKSKR